MDKLTGTSVTDGETYYCANAACDNTINKPEMCCSGADCGCLGQPIEPPVCSDACLVVVYPHLK